ncbi:MAG: metal ABC transporter ATP-binding protein [Reyranellaceae bacterium]
MALSARQTAAPRTGIVLEDLVVAYERRPAVHHLSGAFPAASLTAIVGPNGGGKSTLLKALAGVQPISSGRLDRDGLRRRDIAYLAQHAEIDRSIPITVLDLVCCGFVQRAGLFGGIDRTMRREAQDALALVGLAGFEHRLIDAMSIGQFQRALFARVLVQNARVILLDEPFAAIDAATTADLVGLIGRWRSEGRCIVLVSHDLDLVRRVCPETLLLAREPVAWGPTAQVLTPENLARARRRSEAWDESAGACELSVEHHAHAHH